MDDIAQLNSDMKAADSRYEAAHPGTIHTLHYNSYRRDGIFGTFQFAGDHVPFCDTLSRAYQVNGVWLPKVTTGIYGCVRGMHQLQDGIPFETFEIIMAGHHGLLFHPLNYNKDSHGCTGLGASTVRYDSNQDGRIDELDDEMITASRKTFAAWMSRLAPVNEFTLRVL